MTFVPAVLRPDPTTPADEEPLWLVLHGDQVVVAAPADGDEVVLPAGPAAATLVAAAADRQHLGLLAGRAVEAIALDAAVPLAAGWSGRGLRSLWNAVDEETWTLIGRAVQILGWSRDHRFCSRCAAVLEEVPGERARHCPLCGLNAYPRLSPAVIMLVTDDADRALLAQGIGFARPWFSCLAGFVEPGETLEETVVREVAEETGIVVADVRYVASQPWPFPHSLMIGFTARAIGGELAIDPAEIAAAAWFNREEPPLVPPPPSIANRLITDWLRG